MKRNKLIVICMTLILLITGCSNTTKTTKDKNIKGRYVETQCSLPDNLDSNAKMQFTKKNGYPFLYVINNEKTLTMKCYQMNEDSSWTASSIEWIDEVLSKTSNLGRFQVLEDLNGRQYLYIRDNDTLEGICYYSDNGTTYDSLTFEGWNEKIEGSDYYYSPEKITILKDGTFSALFPRGDVMFYDKDTRKKTMDLSNISNVSYSTSLLAASDHSIYLAQRDDQDNVTGIDVVDTSKDYKITNYPYETVRSSYYYFDTNDKNDLVLCNADGIHILEQGTSIWQTVVDGTLTSLSMPTMWSMGFIADSQSSYYILYNSDSGFNLKKYVFDKNVDTVPSTEITIYSLKDNSTLREAAAVFQQSHPDVKITFNIMMSSDEYESADSAIKEDYIRALNTELLAGSGSDILVLDDLPADSFISKDVLTDLSDVIQPMIDKGELFPNIMNTYVHDNKIYSVPVRFSLQLLCGRTSEVRTLNSLENLSEYSSTHTDASLMGHLTLDDFITTFSPYLSNHIMDSKGKIDKEQLLTLLTQLKKISDNCGIVDQYNEEEGRGNNIWDLASSIQLSLYQSNGFLDSMFPLGIVSYVKGDFIPFDNTFMPKCELGINQASKNKDLCKAFISLVLSKDILKNDLYDGYPINQEAFAEIANKDHSDSSASSEIENADGSYSEIIFGNPTKEQVNTMITACSQVTNKGVCDTQIIKAFKEETKEFFQGNLTVEETADLIIEKTNIYLSE